MADELNTRVNMAVQAGQVMTVPIDKTLSIEGQAADAKAVGDALADKADRSELGNQITVNGQAPDAQGLILISADDVPITDDDPTRLSAVLQTMQEDIDGKTAEDIPVAQGSSTTVADALRAVASATTADHIQLTAEDPTTVKDALDEKLTEDDIDTELKTAGKAADALATGNAIKDVDEAAVKSVNGIGPDEDGNVAVTEVENARQLVSSRNISTTGSFVVRPTSGHGSVSDGTATLRRIVGKSVHTGYVPEVLTVTVDAATRPVPAAITGEIDAATFEAYVITAGTYSTSYDGTSWSVDPALYGITLAGTPIDGDSITIVWDGETDPVMTISAAQREPAPEITATIDKDTFRGYVTQDAVIDLYYTSEWSADPTLYGLTIVGDPIPGDHIRITYVKLDRGVITSANPVRVVGTGWNLFRLTDGWARVCRYSEVYGYRIGGTYATVAFAETLEGDQTTITPDADGLFNVPGDGYLLIGGGSSDTYVYTTWSDWIQTVPEYEAYTESAVNLASVMTDFPGGLCSVGDVADEIDFDRQIAISRIQRMTLTAENLAAAEASGRAWDADREWIYLVRAAAVETRISVEPSYTVNEHGLEILEGSTVPAWVEAMYGTNLRDKLERDVVTVSAQELTEPQKAQVRSNIGAGSAADVASLNDNIANLRDGLSYVEDGTTIAANAAYTAGKFICWQGEMYRIKATINTTVTSGNWTTYLDKMDGMGGALSQINADLTSLNDSIADINSNYLSRFKFWYLNNNASGSVTISPTHDFWLFYRSYQPNILKINYNGEVEVVVGKNQSIEISASNNVITIKNTIGWGLPMFGIIIGAF